MSNDELIATARKHVGAFALSEPDFSAASVASALLTEAGNVYTGVCLDVACGIGFCAEHAAVAAMLQGRETVVAKIVATTASEILPPCGRCRELLVQVDRRNLACEVMVGPGRSVLLREILPLSGEDEPPQGKECFTAQSVRCTIR